MKTLPFHSAVMRCAPRKRRRWPCLPRIVCNALVALILLSLLAAFARFTLG